ncbi:hypothetical protein HVH64_004506 [Salmonella enterica]|nr:hypothetical protein [Salmonella enterica]EFU0780396.1 hypothetical protein [Salmonella enterica]EJI8765816.1 hypothetical protein [Salmonella enterica]EKZ8200033.1 hypothetical protein [Salmonella enterica]ELT7563559.1 hypothetical protein [Salmonella enterica]
MKKWYLLYYKSRQYKNIADHLSRLNIDYYMPMTTILSLRADSLTSHRKYEVPYFAGYVFIFIDINETHPSTIMKIPSAIDFVKTGGEIKEINEEIIIGLKIAPMVVEEIEILGSPPVIYCDNCSYDVLCEVMERFHRLTGDESNDERVMWLLNMIDDVITRKQHQPVYGTLPSKFNAWLDKIIDYKQSIKRG